jgi:pimeloyl-ACP methyl ester carboxylesterase
MSTPWSLGPVWLHQPLLDSVPADMEAPEPQFIESSDGVRIALHFLGGPSDPEMPTLLFSHATGFHGRVFEPIATILRDRYHCLAIDYRGHGLSEIAPEVSLKWSGMADDAVAMLESLPAEGPIHGVGHSMGGAALVLAAARLPHRLQSLWLYEPVIMAPGLSIMTDGPNPMSDAALRRRDRFDSYDAALRNFASKPPLNQLHPDALWSYVDGGFAREPDGTVTLRCRPSTEAQVFQLAARSGTWNVLDEVHDIDIAIVAGRHEAFGPVAFAPAVAETLARGSLIERPQLGHFGPLEDPTSMAADIAAWVDAHP